MKNHSFTSKNRHVLGQNLKAKSIYFVLILAFTGFLGSVVLGCTGIAIPPFPYVVDVEKKTVEPEEFDVNEVERYIQGDKPNFIWIIPVVLVLGVFVVYFLKKK